jgi:hypothetical protein
MGRTYHPCFPGYGGGGHAVRAGLGVARLARPEFLIEVDAIAVK